MSRRRASRQDSLELLLDTICNTFGGVLFIAILVVLLLQQTGGSPDVPSPVVASTVELQSLVIRMEAVAADLTRRQQNRDSQQAIVQKFATEAIREQIVQRQAVTVEQEALQAAVDQLLTDTVTLAGQVETLEADNVTVAVSLQDALTRRKQAESDLEDARQARVEEVRMPVVQSSGRKQEIGLILRYGRLYVWHNYGPMFVRLGLNTDDFVVLSEENGGLASRPKPTAGFALDETAESQEAVRQLLRRFDTQSCYFAIIVRPDSYGVFRHFRDRAIEFGFQYRLMPVETDTPITDRGGSGSPVQ